MKKYKYTTTMVVTVEDPDKLFKAAIARERRCQVHPDTIKEAIGTAKAPSIEGCVMVMLDSMGSSRAIEFHESESDCKEVAEDFSLWPKLAPEKK